MMTYIKRIELPSVEVHTSCVCYQKGDERTIRQWGFEPGTVHTILTDAHSIVFVLKGGVRLSALNLGNDVSLECDDFVFLPAGTRTEFEAHESVSVLLVKLEDLVGQIPECDTFRFQRTVPPDDTRETGIYPLRTNDRIKHFLEGLMSTEADGLKCSSYARLLAGQLMFLVQVYYTQDEYTRFYSSVFSPDVVFSDFVIKNWRKYMAVNELADALNMTPQQLTSRFRKVFGKTAQEWLQARKADYVYHDVCSSHKSLKSIAHEYGFSMPNFIRFCRTNFGATPGTIRSNLSARLGGGTCGVGDGVPHGECPAPERETNNEQF
ncbi:MAG: AraC family transcriptional regulator [Alistipes sp.]|jgi:AraC-like DNA-binding protein/uncharacterized cupin superfamily protein|nr:AraC family transcriptional regulator [Alistipes sp.]